MNVLMSASLLFSIFILQRIDAFGTSVAMLALGIIFLFILARGLIRGGVTLSRDHAMWLYPLYLFSFTYQLPLEALIKASLDAYVVFIAPVLVWLILITQPDFSVSSLLNRKVLVAVTIAVGFYLVRDFFSVLSDGTDTLKKTYTFANPNYTGFLLNILLIFFVSTEKENKVTLAGTAYLFLNTILIALTLSKTAYAIQLIVIVLYLRHRLLYTAIIAIPAGAFAATKYLDFFELFSNFFKRSSDAAISNRIGLMRCALDAFLDNPLFGVGYGNFMEIGNRIYHTPLDVKVHNLFLSSLAENGIVGFSLLLLSITALLFRLAVWKTASGIMMTLSLLAYASTHTGVESLSLLPAMIFVLAPSSRTTIEQSKSSIE